jgi:hypothetical protein
MGVLPSKKSLVQCEKLAVSAFCRRRLSVVMVRLRMAETLREAVTFVEQVRACVLACLCPSRVEIGAILCGQESA